MAAPPPTFWPIPPLFFQKFVLFHGAFQSWSECIFLSEITGILIFHVNPNAAQVTIMTLNIRGHQYCVDWGGLMNWCVKLRVGDHPPPPYPVFRPSVFKNHSYGPVWYWYFNDTYHDTAGHKLIECFIVRNNNHSNCWRFSFRPFCILFRSHKHQNDVITRKQNIDLIEIIIHFFVKMALCFLISW